MKKTSAKNNGDQHVIKTREITASDSPLLIKLMRQKIDSLFEPECIYGDDVIDFVLDDAALLLLLIKADVKKNIDSVFEIQIILLDLLTSLTTNKTEKAIKFGHKIPEISNAIKNSFSIVKEGINGTIDINTHKSLLLDTLKRTYEITEDDINKMFDKGLIEFVGSKDNKQTQDWKWNESNNMLGAFFHSRLRKKPIHRKDENKKYVDHKTKFITESFLDRFGKPISQASVSKVLNQPPNENLIKRLKEILS